VTVDPSALERGHDLVTSYVLLRGASLLHVAAEFGNVAAARALIEAGADPDATAAVDEHGLGGQTAIFHTVCSNNDHCAPVMHVLLDAGARPDPLVSGLRWGVGFPWETTVHDVTPVSFALCGLLPQFHRDPADVYGNAEVLLAAAGRPVPPRANVPNAYVSGTKVPGD
ncbi:MAG: ankyrin repeat domain-containing protein, partial [Gemmatimonadota bacterium]|nr:ankyrin repeat domain-containing protein [Gemmatimonadota bacterium]